MCQCIVLSVDLGFPLWDRGAPQETVEPTAKLVVSMRQLAHHSDIPKELHVKMIRNKRGRKATRSVATAGGAPKSK
jgi:hypothetical protein